MTPSEISEILSRIDALEDRCMRNERMLWLIIGLGVGTGVLSLTQLLGAI